jgi:hypothetical protein
MTTLIQTFNFVLTGLFDLLFLPLRLLPPLWALLVFSLPAGLLMLWVFGKTSNQPALKRIKEQIRGGLLGVRLFQHDLRVMTRLQGRILLNVAAYLRHSLVPMLVLIVPFVLICIQLNLRYGARPLDAGKPAVVKVRVSDESALNGAVTLEAPGGVSIETFPVRIPTEREIAWRIRVAEPGRYALIVRANGEELSKELLVGERWGKVSIRREGKSAWAMLLHPGETPLPASVVESIEVIHPPLPLTIFGWSFHWLLLFIVFTIVFGYAFKGFLGVEL